MSVNLRVCFWISLLLFSGFLRGVLSIKKGYYTIVLPATIEPDSTFHVSLTLNDFHKSCWFNISLTTFIREEKIHDFESIEVQPGTTELIELKAPPYKYHVGNIEITGYRGIISQQKTQIYFGSNELWTFIQTNKDQYRPGELVQIRVICIDQLTRPEKLDREVSVEVYDGQYNLVKGLYDVKFSQGVLKTSIQLSNYPVLGIWKVKVRGVGIYTERSFEVDRYVLPKFDVKINAKIVRHNRKHQVQLEISASYFYGEPVKGNLFVSFINTRVPISSWTPVLSTVTQDSRIDGKATMFIDLENYINQIYDQHKDERPLSPYSLPPEIYTFSIEASLIDDLSEEQSSTETEISLYTAPYSLEIESSEEFKAEEILKFKIKVFLKDITDAVIEDPMDPIEVVLGCGHVIGYNRHFNEFDTIRVEYKNEAGKDFTVVNMTNKDYNECFVYAEYQRIKSSTEHMFPGEEEAFNINILTESPEEGKELEVQITNPEPLEEFSYEIFARGDIIQSARVIVPGNQTSYILRLNVTFPMVPRITIYAHCIKDVDFSGKLKDVVIKRSLENSIKIETVEETKPGKPVNINVTTDAGSYVGLMGLDRSALQNVIEENVFGEDLVKNKIKWHNSVRQYPTPLNGITRDIITFSNVFPPGGRENGRGEDGELAGGGDEQLVRNIFPDSWLFVDFERAPEGGLKFMETPPDSITTWAITGFSLHPETGLAFTKNTTNLRVFQEFFVSMDLPSLMKQDEIIEVPIFISNYMDQDANVNLTIESNSDGGFDILDSPDSSSTPKQTLSKLVSKKERAKCIVFLRPLKSGNFNVTVTAISSLASDVIRKTLNVQSEGIPYAMSKTSLVHLPEEGSQETEITVDIPSNAVPGSQKVEVSVVGDIFRPLIQNLQKLAKVPYGNSEDNIRLLVSNTIVLKYLKALNQIDPSLESQMKLNLELGYQNELAFKYLDGSFGLFERRNGERTGDVWQTIFALWGLIYAEDLVLIDSKLIRRGLEYLKSKQDKSGCYKSQGDDVEENVKLTAFGLMVFLMDEDSYSREQYKEIIEKGLAYLYKVSEVLEYSPISVVSAYVLHLGKHEKAEDFLRRLTSNSSLTAKQKLWTKSNTLQSHLEAITGSLMNLFEPQEISEQNILQIIRGLIVPKQEESFITHMVALQAMISFAEKFFNRQTDLEISFKDDHNKSGHFHVNDENSQVLQTIELASNSKKIQVQSKGSGFAIVDVKYEYNLLPENQSSDFYFTNVSVEIYSDFLIYIPICLKALRNNTGNKFIVMEVSLQSGYIFTDGNYNDIENQSENIKSIQFNDGREKAVIYFDYDPATEVCIELEARKTYKVINSKPGWVIVYGERDKDQKSFNSFMVDES